MHERIMWEEIKWEREKKGRGSRAETAGWGHEDSSGSGTERGWTRLGAGSYPVLSLTVNTASTVRDGEQSRASGRCRDEEEAWKGGGRSL